MSWRISLFILLLHPLASLANTKCEAFVESVFVLTEVGLREKELSPADVEYMIASPTEVHNPYSRLIGTVGNVALRQNLIKNLRKVKPDQVQALRSRLAELIKSNAKMQEMVEDSKQKSAWIVSPKIKEIPGLHKVDFSVDASVHWHRDQNGDLNLVVYDPFTLELKVFSLDGKRPPVSHSLANTHGQKPQSILAGEVSFLSLKNGNLIVAHRLGEGDQALIHDFNLNNTIAMDLTSGTKHIHVMKGLAEKIYVVAETLRSYTTYELGVFDAKVVHHAYVSEVFRANHIMNSPGGRILIAFTDYTSVVRIIDPITKEERKFHAKDAIEGITGLFQSEENYIYAFKAHHKRSPNYRWAFLDSHSEEARYTAYYSPLPSASSLFQTSGGKIYLALGVSQEMPPESGARKYIHHVKVYDALKPAQPKPLWRRLLGQSGVVTPVFDFGGGEGLDHGESPAWLEPRPGRLILTQRTDGPTVEIYDLGAKENPISTIDIGSAASSFPSRESEAIALAPVATPTHFLVQVYTNNTEKTEFYEGRSPPIKAAEIPYRPVLEAVMDKDQGTYLVTKSVNLGFNPTRKGQIQVIQITVGGTP